MLSKCHTIYGDCSKSRILHKKTETIIWLKLTNVDTINLTYFISFNISFVIYLNNFLGIQLAMNEYQQKIQTQSMC